MANKLNSVPLDRDGFVIGAEMTDVVFGIPPRKPCETVPTGTGERGAGPSLSYGTERSLRSRPDNEGCLDLWALLFLPKILSIASGQRR